MGGVLIVTAAIGSILMPAGTGNPIIPGVGRRFIMAGGNCMIGAAGFGRRIRPGDQPGGSGAHQEITAVGRPYRPTRDSTAALAGDSMACAVDWISISACGLTALLLSPSKTSPIGTSAIGIWLRQRSRGCIATRSEERRVGKECRSRWS